MGQRRLTRDEFKRKSATPLEGIMHKLSGRFNKLTMLAGILVTLIFGLLFSGYARFTPRPLEEVGFKRRVQ
jgi:hypothetical protein